MSTKESKISSNRETAVDKPSSVSVKEWYEWYIK